MLNSVLPVNSLFQQLTVEYIREEIKDFKTFIFAPVSDIPFEAGQFLTFVENKGQEKIRRSYSILSTPLFNEPLSISVKRIDNGYFSRKLVDKTKPGDIFLTTGASGFFRLPETINAFTRIFFFAAGSGIVPVIPLIKTILHLHPEKHVNLIYSNGSVETTAFYELFIELKKRNKGHFHVDFLYSSSPRLNRARLNRELIIELLEMHKASPLHSLFFICGPENYMRMVIFNLIEEGYPKENIRKEDFNPGHKKPAPHHPPDKQNYRVQLNLHGKTYEFAVEYPDSILQSARKHRLELPYSCETGKCGSCAAYCKSGEIWMSNNEVLSDTDLSKGIILTCTGHPQHGDVSLKI